MNIRTSREQKRGCGYRKPGGLYLVSGGTMEPCPKLPIPLTVCPTCSGGIKPTRGWTWIEADPIVKPAPHGDDEHWPCCPLSVEIGRAGLLWIGEKFYPRPADWTREAVEMGVSRRIPAIPRNFVLGETLVLVAHRKTIDEPCPEQMHEGANGSAEPCEKCGGDEVIWSPAIFHAFRPTAIEYVVKGDESEEELERLVARGIDLVDVLPVQTELAP